jgi:hypothetical protein
MEKGPKFFCIAILLMSVMANINLKDKNFKRVQNSCFLNCLSTQYEDFQNCA